MTKVTVDHSEHVASHGKTAADFIALHKRLGISRGELCRLIGIAPNSGTAYALGRRPIPLTVALACAAIEQGNSK